MKAIVIVIPDEDAEDCASLVRQVLAPEHVDPQVIGWPPDPVEIDALL